MPAALQPGELGAINLVKDRNGIWRARARYRDLSGRVRWLRGEGSTRKKASRDLRKRFGTKQGATGLTKNSTVAEVATAWLEHKRATKLDGIKEQSYRQYESTLRNHILPRFKTARLSEMTVTRMSEMLKTLAADKSPSVANIVRGRLIEVYNYAIQQELAKKNVAALTDKFEHRAPRPVAFTDAEVATLRELLQNYRRGEDIHGPRPDGQLALVLEVMLGASIRPGEVLALRRCDVDQTAHPMTISVEGTIVQLTGRGKFRQGIPKKDGQERVIALPSFAADAIRRRLVLTAGQGSEALLFQTKEGTPFAVSEMGAQIRRFKAANASDVRVDWSKFTAYTYRKTAATAVRRDGGLSLAQELLGHATEATTKEHYVEPLKSVPSITASILEARFAPEGVVS